MIASQAVPLAVTTSSSGSSSSSDPETEVSTTDSEEEDTSGVEVVLPKERVHEQLEWSEGNVILYKDAIVRDALRTWGLSKWKTLSDQVQHLYCCRIKLGYLCGLVALYCASKETSRTILSLLKTLSTCEDNMKLAQDTLHRTLVGIWKCHNRGFRQNAPFYFPVAWRCRYEPKTLETGVLPQWGLLLQEACIVLEQFVPEDFGFLGGNPQLRDMAQRVMEEKSRIWECPSRQQSLTLPASIASQVAEDLKQGYVIRALAEDDEEEEPSKCACVPPAQNNDQDTVAPMDVSVENNLKESAMAHTDEEHDNSSSRTVTSSEGWKKYPFWTALVSHHKTLFELPPRMKPPTIFKAKTLKKPPTLKKPKTLVKPNTLKKPPM